jgi:hypothetical protein
MIRWPSLCLPHLSQEDGDSRTDPGCAYDYGWHAAADALATGKKPGEAVLGHTWWLDVETTKQVERRRRAAVDRDGRNNSTARNACSTSFTGGPAKMVPGRGRAAVGPPAGPWLCRTSGRSGCPSFRATVGLHRRTACAPRQVPRGPREMAHPSGAGSRTASTVAVGALCSL